MMFGIKNYEPNFVHDTADIISQCGHTLRELQGKTIREVFILWNITLDEWHNDAPVILQVDDIQVEMCAYKLDEFSITFNAIDRSLDVEQLDLGEIGVWHFEWRSDPQHQNVIGKRITKAEVIEFQFRTRVIKSVNPDEIGHEEVGWLLHGLGFKLDDGYFAVFNGLDENAISRHRLTGEDLNYISV